jgi:hypothetical protein
MNKVRSCHSGVVEDHSGHKCLEGLLRKAWFAGLDMGEDSLPDGEKIDEKCREDRYAEWRLSIRESASSGEGSIPA